jgi:hypothetical protein
MTASTPEATQMSCEATLEEAEILIATLRFAEGMALMMSPSMVEALKALRPWRSAFLRAYLAAKPNEAKP